MLVGTSSAVGAVKVSRSGGSMQCHWQSVDCASGGLFLGAVLQTGPAVAMRDEEGTEGGALGMKPVSTLMPRCDRQRCRNEG